METSTEYYISSAMSLVLAGLHGVSPWWPWERYWFTKTVALSTAIAIMCEMVCRTNISELGLDGDEFCRLWTLAVSYSIATSTALAMLLPILPRGPFWRLALQFIISVLIGVTYADTKRGIPIPVILVYVVIMMIGQGCVRYLSVRRIYDTETAYRYQTVFLLSWFMVFLALLLQTWNKLLLYLMDFNDVRRGSLSQEELERLNVLEHVIGHEFAPFRRLFCVIASIGFHAVDYSS
jgi:hypothetical protein